MDQRLLSISSDHNPFQPGAGPKPTWRIAQPVLKPGRSSSRFVASSPAKGGLSGASGMEEGRAGGQPVTRRPPARFCLAALRGAW